MLEVSERDVLTRLDFDNPWWKQAPEKASYMSFPERSYLPLFLDLAAESVRRAIILMGPRRVGKTVILQQSILKWIADGTPGKQIMFLSLETPLYTDIPLEKFVRLFLDLFGHGLETPLTIIFDEIQYLRDWERHLTSLVNSFPAIRFIASGSAAAALKLKSRESGAGRFTEFLLPPLTFAEYLRFIGKEDELILPGTKVDPSFHRTTDIEALNRHFIDYLNIGGYPEAVFNDAIRRDRDRFIKSDIIDKVLLRDLPQLYGIRDIQELNRLFNVLAYNTGNEVSLDGLAKSSGVSKTTLSKYLEYLEAAFLIKRVYRIDQNARRFQRATSFKVYLTNPTMRSALFGPMAEDDESMGSLAETALFAQWFHSLVADRIYYARWPQGEVDLVFLGAKTQKPLWCVEVKWSDRPAHDTSLFRHLVAFWNKHRDITTCWVTTRTTSEPQQHGEKTFLLRPTSLLTYSVGYNIVKDLLPKLKKRAFEIPSNSLPSPEEPTSPELT